MDQPVKEFPTPSFIKNRLIIVGGYGSGKSEVAINLARHLAVSQNRPVAIADLDIVNPYFRSREADEQLEKLTVKTLNPRGGYRHADLPIILPEIRGSVERHDGVLILDIGGDDVGARILSSLAGSFTEGEYELLLVLNANRPFTQDVDGCVKLIGEIEAASRLKFTGTIANTHLLEDTTAETVLSGMNLAGDLHQQTGLPTVFMSSTREVLETIDIADIDVPVLVLDRLLLKPWERPMG
ncbi:MAG: cobalamin biosynthesis protein CbiA [bacterium]